MRAMNCSPWRVDVVDVDAAVDQVRGALGDDGRLELARVDVVGDDVVLQAAEQRGHQGLDGLVHLALVSAELAGDIRYRDLVEEVVETGHVMLHLRCWCCCNRSRH